MSTPKEKNEKKPVLEKVRPYLQVLMTTLLVAVTSAIFIKGPLLLRDIDDRAFTDSKKRMETEDFMGDMTKKEVYDEFKHHVTDPGIHMPMEQKDSFYVRRSEFEETYKANAIDIYNLKKDIKKESEQQEDRYFKLKSTLEIIEWKIDQLEK